MVCQEMASLLQTEVTPIQHDLQTVQQNLAGKIEVQTIAITNFQQQLNTSQEQF